MSKHVEKVPLNRINQTQWGSATCHIVGDTLGWGKRESKNKTTKESMVNLQEIKCDLFFKIKNKDRSTWPKHLSSGVYCMLYVVVSDQNFVTSFKQSRNILALSANKIELNSSKTDSKLSLTHSFSHISGSYVFTKSTLCMFINLSHSGSWLLTACICTSPKRRHSILPAA